MRHRVMTPAAVAAHQNSLTCIQARNSQTGDGLSASKVTRHSDRNSESAQLNSFIPSKGVIKCFEPDLKLPVSSLACQCLPLARPVARQASSLSKTVMLPRLRKA